MLLQSITKIYRKSGQDEFKMQVRVCGHVIEASISGIDFKKLALTAIAAGLQPEVTGDSLTERVTVYHCLPAHEEFHG